MGEGEVIPGNKREASGRVQQRRSKSQTKGMLLRSQQWTVGIWFCAALWEGYRMLPRIIHLHTGGQDIISHSHFPSDELIIPVLITPHIQRRLRGRKGKHAPDTREEWHLTQSVRVWDPTEILPQRQLKSEVDKQRWHRAPRATTDSCCNIYRWNAIYPPGIGF